MGWGLGDGLRRRIREKFEVRAEAVTAVALEAGGLMHERERFHRKGLHKLGSLAIGAVDFLGGEFDVRNRVVEE
jgi:hypothetical protein